MSQFYIEEPKIWTKSFPLNGPEDFRAYVDYDDVDGPVVLEITRKIVDILNRHWESITELYRCFNENCDDFDLSIEEVCKQCNQIKKSIVIG